MKRNPIYWHTTKAKRMCDVHGDTVITADTFAICTECKAKVVIVKEGGKP